MNQRLLKQLTPWVLLLLVGAGTLAFRAVVIEMSSLSVTCLSNTPPTWCQFRQWIVLGFLNNVFGSIAVAAAVLALFSRRIGVAWLAAALGVFAMQLYGYQLGGPALLVGCLRLLRLQANAAPGQQHGQGQRQVEAQP